MGPNAEHALVAQVMGLASMDLVEMALATVMKDGDLQARALPAISARGAAKAATDSSLGILWMENAGARAIMGITERIAACMRLCPRLHNQGSRSNSSLPSLLTRPQLILAM